MGTPRDLTGRRFGRLTVLERAGSTPGGRALWRCRCDCGNITDVASANLQSGHTISCGCARREAGHANAENLTGRRFGRLVAVARAPGRRGNSALWRCRCDCGRETVTSNSALKTGQCQSCGCLASEVSSVAIAAAQEARKKDYVDGTDVRSLTDKPPAHNSSGVRGVSWDRSVGLWRADIIFRGKRYRLGSSVDFNRAVALRKEGEAHIWGDFLGWYNSRESTQDS